MPIARDLVALGFEILASGGTQATLAGEGIEATKVPKLSEGRPNIIDLMKNGQVQLIINTPTRKGPQTDEGKIRSTAVLSRVPILTTLTAGAAAAKAIAAVQKSGWGVKPLQAYKDEG